MSTPEFILAAIVAAVAGALGLGAVFRRKAPPRPPTGPAWEPAEVTVLQQEADRRRAEAARIREEIAQKHAEARSEADARADYLAESRRLDELLRAEREERS